MAKQLSEDLQREIKTLREQASQLRDAITSDTLKSRLDLALMDLDEIPRLFDSEIYMRQALMVPIARIAMVRRIVEKYGPNATAIPGDI